MFKFITQRPLWVNVLAGAVLAILLFAIFLFSLGWLTDHGKSAAVPSITGKSLEEAKSILSKAGFDYEVRDSVFVDTLPPLTVVRQLPDAYEVVKSNRTVLLIVRSVDPPLVEIPNLIGYSFRSAEFILQSMELKVGDTIFRPDFARNAVLEQRVAGAKVTPGTKIRKGTAVTLVLGDGLGGEGFPVPQLIGMRYADALSLLESSRVGVGALILDPAVKDTLNAFIYKQSPLPMDEEKITQHIRPGQLIDLWLQVEKPQIDSIQ